MQGNANDAGRKPGLQLEGGEEAHTLWSMPCPASLEARGMTVEEKQG